jgi:Tfp pilus assembly protein PilO
MAKKEKVKKEKVKKEKKPKKKIFTQKTFGGITAVGLCALLLIYVFVYQDYINKTEEIEASNSELKATINELQEYSDNMSVYQNEIEEMKVAIGDILEEYPAGAREEDAIMMAVKMQTKNQIGFDAINMEETETVYTIPYSEVSIANIEGLEGDLTFLRKRATYSNTTTYSDLKSVIGQVYDSSNRIGINSIVYAKNEEEGTLSGNIDLYYYSVTGTDKEYSVPNIAAYIMGTDDIFNSAKSLALQEEESEEGETEGEEDEEEEKATKKK